MPRPKHPDAPRPKKPWNQLTPEEAASVRARRAKFRSENDPRIKKFADWILSLRKAANFTQEEMAHRVGVNALTVRRWERGWGFLPQPGRLKIILEFAKSFEHLQKLGVKFEKR